MSVGPFTPGPREPDTGVNGLPVGGAARTDYSVRRALLAPWLEYGEDSWTLLTWQSEEHRKEKVVQLHGSKRDGR